MYSNMYCWSPPPPLPPVKPCTYYDFLVVVDFEATCDDSRNNAEQIRPLRSERPEIIQFPACLINVHQCSIVDSFDSFVKPVEQQVLSDFCTSLTGITQEMVDNASPFPKVLRKFERWLRKHGLSLSSMNAPGRTFALVCDGSYDMGHFLYKQSLISNIPYPSYARRWVNIRTIFSKFYGLRWYNLKNALELIGKPFQGRQHNGLDDSKNIAKIVVQFLAEGCVITQTEKIVLDSRDQEENEIRILNDKHAGKYDLATVKPVSSNEFKLCMPGLPPNNVFLRQPPETDPLPSTLVAAANNKMENKENLPTSRGVKERKKTAAETTIKKQFYTNGKQMKKRMTTRDLVVSAGTTPINCGKAASADETLNFISVTDEE